MKKKLTICLLLLLAVIAFGCNKEWLDIKPIDSQVVPITIADAQALLDNSNALNGLYPIAEMSTGDYELTDPTILSLPVVAWRNAYIWKSDIWEGQIAQDWINFYNNVFIANVALETLDKLEASSGNSANFRDSKGQGLFVRAFASYNLASLYAKPYQLNGNNLELGIPLRLSADINEPSVRSTVAQTYGQIIQDLKASVTLLPITQPNNIRPSKAAAYGMLARVLLIMGDYTNAELYADSCLKLKSSLIDFNSLSLTSTTPISTNNIESIYYVGMSNIANLRAGNIIIPNSIYQMYDSNDLRKDVYFYVLNGILTRKGSYSGFSICYGGIAIDEQYLIRAEARARQGKITEAMIDLNFLLINRYKTGTFTPLTATNADDALVKILRERRKELIYRGLRWTDLRRLNQDTKFAVTLSRTYNNVTYTLPPNDKRYTFAIPDIEIQKYGMPQNDRN
jgi:hypothetical protein